MTNPTRVAFVKFGGASAGGTEKFIQTIAANLPKDRFDVTYFYCDAAPYIGSHWKHPDTEPSRLKYLTDSGIKVVKFSVEAKDVTKPDHPWINTDFWNHFKEEDFDVVFTGRSGHSEYPFNRIRNIPIVDSLHLPRHLDTQSNIEAVIHVSDWNRKLWESIGGNPQIAHTVYHPISLPNPAPVHLRDLIKSQGGSGSEFIFGMHQRADNGIYSPIPLLAYSKIMSPQTAFILLGGGDKYRQQAEELDLINFYWAEPTGDFSEVIGFLKELNLYCHGRADGENNSQAIAEAMGCGLPVISHTAPAMGHAEQIGDAGFVLDSVEKYAQAMEVLMKDTEIREILSKRARARFEDLYSLDKNVNKIAQIIEEVVRKPSKVVSEDPWLQEWING